MENGLVFAGNPDSVYQQIMKFSDYVGGFGHILLMARPATWTTRKPSGACSCLPAKSTPGSRSRLPSPRCERSDKTPG